MNKKNNTKRKKLVEIDKNDGGDKDRKRKKMEPGKNTEEL